MVWPCEGHIGKVTRAGNKIFEKAMLILTAHTPCVYHGTKSKRNKNVIDEIAR